MASWTPVNDRTLLTGEEKKRPARQGLFVSGYGLKRFFLSFALLAVVALLVSLWGMRQYQAFLASPVFPGHSDTELLVPEGSSYRRIIQLIKEKGAVGENWQWRLLGKLSGLENRLKAGEYAFSAGIAPRRVLQKLANGDVKTYAFTIIEGQSWKQLRQQLLDDPVLSHPLADYSDKELLQWLQATEPSPEGLFLPETWQYRRGDSDLDVLRRAHLALRKVLSSAWEGRQKNLPLKSPYEMLILASIVEKETALPEEKPQVAGVFVRRLHKGMRLQTDPTVIYGLGDDYAGDITYAHLRTDTPYNTYTRAGLPPTPISMAGADSIRAVAHPAEGDALYFVADNRGGHTFSKDFRSHQKAVRNYLAGQKKARNKKKPELNGDTSQKPAGTTHKARRKAEQHAGQD